MQHRGMYAIIPAIVRYDSELPGNAKLLYGELTALANEKGYCWAANKYFADLYKVSKRTVSGWISKLEERNYITVELDRKENSYEVGKRYIYISPLPMDGDFYGGGNKFRGGIEENFQPPTKKTSNRIIQSNNTTNTKYIYIDQFSTLWEKYPKKTQKQKALEQFKKKVTDDESLATFEKGFNNYLSYIQLNSWYSPAELFRWIRDERYTDEYDLTPPKPQGFQRQPIRQEKIPDSIANPAPEEKLSAEQQAEADRMIREMENRRKIK